MGPRIGEGARFDHEPDSTDAEHVTDERPPASIMGEQQWTTGDLPLCFLYQVELPSSEVQFGLEKAIWKVHLQVVDLRCILKPDRDRLQGLARPTG